MSVPRLKAEMGLLELAALARLRGAFLVELLERLPSAMRKRTAARGSSGDLREKLREALKQATAAGFEGEDAQVVAVAALLDQEALEVLALLRSEVAREFENAANAEGVVALATRAGEHPG